jgi:hypothetical protein
MKTALAIVALVVMALGLSVVPAAQPGPPRTYTCQWTHDSSGGAAESFQILVDGAVSVTVNPATACSGTPVLACTSPLTMTTQVNHTVIVQAVNLFGEANSVPFTAAPPVRPAGVTIR